MEAAKLQKLLGVEDNELILYGYTFARDSVFAYFELGKLCVATAEYNHPAVIVRYPKVYGYILRDGIKRFYRQSTLPALRELMETFGESLSETDGNGRQYNARDKVYF